MRAILAVVVGFVVWTVLWMATNAAGMALMPEAFDDEGLVQSMSLLLLYLAASVICSLVAGWVAAKISRGGVSRNVIILAGILVAVGLYVEISYWTMLPVWYHLAFLVLLAPATIAGGRMVNPAG